MKTTQRPTDPCNRCKSPAGACLCGREDYELGRIFGAHQVLKGLALTGAGEEAWEDAVSQLAEVIDDAEVNVRRRALERLTADRGRAPLTTAGVN